MFSLIFGTNALGIAVMAQVSGWLVGRVSPRRLLAGALAAVAIGGAALLLVVIARIWLIGILPALFVVVSSQGMVFPNATALAMANHPRTAGSASALLSVLQFAFGAAIAPLVGIAGPTTVLPMAVVIAALGGSALAIFALLGRSDAEVSSSMIGSEGEKGGNA